MHCKSFSVISSFFFTSLGCYCKAHLQPGFIKCCVTCCYKQKRGKNIFPPNFRGGGGCFVIPDVLTLSFMYYGSILCNDNCIPQSTIHAIHAEIIIITGVVANATFGLLYNVVTGQKSYAIHLHPFSHK